MKGCSLRPLLVLTQQSATGSGFLLFDLEPGASFAKEKRLVLLELVEARGQEEEPPGLLRELLRGQ